jgi:UDP-GlcNAc:undecaprenyl-phosphate/decaprenyl-phosphate GlcNAc-1-phosphate transferase
MLFIFFASVISTFMLFNPGLIIAMRVGMTDKPGHRKVHYAPTPVVGGIIIVLSALLVSMCLQQPYEDDLKIGFGVIILSLVLGAVDDYSNLSAGYRLKIQTLLSLAVCLIGYRIENLHGLLGIYAIPTYIQYPLTILILTGLINSFNLMDGINGLVGGLSLINFIVLGYSLEYTGDINLSNLAFALAGGLLVFLYYNCIKKRVFLGDAGSMTLGLIQGIMALRLTQDGNNVLASMPILPIIIGLFILPVLDTLRVMGSRIVNKKSPFKPDRSHLHHYMLLLLPEHVHSTLLLSSIHLLLIAGGYFFRNTMAISVTILLLLGVVVMSFAAIIYAQRIKEKLNYIHLLIRQYNLQFNEIK